MGAGASFLARGNVFYYANRVTEKSASNNSDVSSLLSHLYSLSFDDDLTSNAYDASSKVWTIFPTIEELCGFGFECGINLETDEEIELMALLLQRDVCDYLVTCDQDVNIQQLIHCWIAFLKIHQSSNLKILDFVEPFEFFIKECTPKLKSLLCTGDYYTDLKHEAAESNCVSYFEHYIYGEATFSTSTGTSTFRISASDDGSRFSQPDEYFNCKELKARMKFMLEKCFKSLFCHLYKPIRKDTTKYLALFKFVIKKYNCMSLSDFNEFKVIGRSEFTLVTSCRKRSTSQVFALKARRKWRCESSNFPSYITKMCVERHVHAYLGSPFVSELCYAFQSVYLTALVTPLCVVGDLKYLLDMDRNLLSHDQIKFYFAEVACVIKHLHSCGLMHRNINPSNILLHEDGHIRITGLGEVKEYVEENRESDDLTDNMLPIISDSRRSRYLVRKIEEQERFTYMCCFEVAGSVGFMAPEVLQLCELGDERLQRNCPGYDNSCDWWSFGASLFMCHTGRLPYKSVKLFGHIRDGAFVHVPPEFSDVTTHSDSGETYAHQLVYVKTSDIFRYVTDLVDEETQLFLSSLLDFNPNKRLGCGVRGYNDVLFHAYFNNIDWNLMESKLVVPPPLPPVKVWKSHELRQTHLDIEVSNMSDIAIGKFEHVLREENVKDWITDESKTKVLKYFRGWNFVSPESVSDEVEMLKKKK